MILRSLVDLSQNINFSKLRFSLGISTKMNIPFVKFDDGSAAMTNDFLLIEFAKQSLRTSGAKPARFRSSAKTPALANFRNLAGALQDIPNGTYGSVRHQLPKR